jgi:hypothetical protein
MWIAVVALSWFALLTLFTIGWARWQARMEQYDNSAE